MKTISKKISLCFILILSCSSIVLASSNIFYKEIKISNVEVRAENSEDIPDVHLMGPAPPVTSVDIIDAYIENNNVYVVVRVIGYGTKFAYWDNERITDFTTSYLGSYEVYGFDYTYNCGPAEVGNHSFLFRITSSNYPWNTMTASATFTIQ